MLSAHGAAAAKTDTTAATKHRRPHALGCRFARHLPKYMLETTSDATTMYTLQCKYE